MWPSVLQITHRFPAASDRAAGHRAWAIGPVQRKPFGSLSWREEKGGEVIGGVTHKATATVNGLAHATRQSSGPLQLGLSSVITTGETLQGRHYGSDYLHGEEVKD